MENKYIDYNEIKNLMKSRFDFRTKIRLNKHNKKFIKDKCLDDYVVLDKKFDMKQKEAVFTNEINTLVLSGAGCGKTLTIVGKIKYLVEELNILPSDILCISFTNNSVDDLKSKIDYDIDIFTFHKLALEIIKDYKKEYSFENNYLEYIINEIFLSSINNIDSKTLKYFNNIITNFINIYKTNNYDNSYFDKLIKKNNSDILKLIKYIYYIYEEELYSSKIIDFNDLINLSCDLINKYGLKRYYKYIIIDEYQDISINRYKLIKLIKESCNSKIFAVGDDFQSIYRFTGSSINMITCFKKYFGYTKIIKINNTYRNSLELNIVANKFILKNNNQVSKKIYSSKRIDKPIKIIYYNKNSSIKLKRLLNILDRKVLILCRNIYDVKRLEDDEIKVMEDKILYNEREYDYKTIHKSKGLEEENVIILNLEDSIYGFPNKKKDITELILEKEKYKYEEERRLFYVALTRTKNNVYLFSSSKNPSIFIKEIVKYRKYIEVLDL